MPTQVTYETDRISLLRDPTISNALNFYVLCILLQHKRKKIILEEHKQIKKKEMFMCEISIIIILICRKLRLIGPLQQNISTNSFSGHFLHFSK